MAFWADERGDIVSWNELGAAGPREHLECLKAAGFQVQLADHETTPLSDKE